MGTNENTSSVTGLIGENVNTQLSDTYQHKILVKIKESFTEEEQRMVMENFYCYLNHHQTNVFVVSLNRIWKWMEYSQKSRGKELLVNHFVQNVDYVIINTAESENVSRTIHRKTNRRKEDVMMNLHTFKRFCLKANTKKADDIHEYYVKLETLLFEVLQEESDELKQQLQNKDAQIEDKEVQIGRKEKEKEFVRESAILEQFARNTQCVYVGLIDNKSDDGESLVKFGNSNELRIRVAQHKKTYTNFRLLYAFKVVNNTRIEAAMKKHPKLAELRRSLVIGNTRHAELFAIQPNCQIRNYIEEIVAQLEYSPENYEKLVNALQPPIGQDDLIGMLTQQVSAFGQQIHALYCKNTEYARQNECLSRALAEQNNVDVKDNEYEQTVTNLEQTNAELKQTNAEITNNLDVLTVKYNQLLINANRPRAITDTTVITDQATDEDTAKRHIKDKDGLYCIDGVKYAILRGTREEVWSGVAYQTEGKKFKDSLMIGKGGKIVSIKRSVRARDNHNLKPRGAN